MHFLFHIVLILYTELTQLVTQSKSKAWSLTSGILPVLTPVNTWVKVMKKFQKEYPETIAKPHKVY